MRVCCFGWAAERSKRSNLGVVGTEVVESNIEQILDLAWHGHVHKLLSRDSKHLTSRVKVQFPALLRGTRQGAEAEGGRILVSVK